MKTLENELSHAQNYNHVLSIACDKISLSPTSFFMIIFLNITQHPSIVIVKNLNLCMLDAVSF